jgi:hypothetical protein
MSKNDDFSKLETTSDLLLEAAQNYFDALLFLTDRSINYSVDVVGLLASHSLELALKAFLFKQGLSEHKLRNEIGHDLEKAWQQAASCGLLIDVDPPFWVKVLARGHSTPYIYRYPKQGIGVAIPAQDEFLKELEATIRLIQNH